MVEMSTVLLTIFVLLSAVLSFLSVKGKKEAELKAAVKEQALKLFLYAEKQDWIGPHKMDWAAEQIAQRIPGDMLKAVIGEEKIRTWLQGVYTEFKENLKN